MNPKHSDRVRALEKLLHSQYRALMQMKRNFRLELALRRWAALERRQLLEARRISETSYNNQREPLVSVTIPTYNRGRLLVERTLPSILNQTYQHFEIVIVGDCCTDDTEERVARLGDQRIRFLNLPERGKYPEHPLHRWMVAGSVPINKTLELAQGEWFAYLDDDDLFTPDHIETLLEQARRYDYELVFGPSREEVTTGIWQEVGGPRFPTGRRPFGPANVPHSSVMYRSYLRFFRYNPQAWQYGLPTDNLLWQRMGRAGVKAGFVNKILSEAPLRLGEEVRGYFGSHAKKGEDI